ncbi:hypothetical protein EJB05_17259 [Eragrostis curvula]|uniref:Mitochondrial carrier protein n=1 Tax=Eragrostis curvula TaxID=38414 RepID=A0A5J9VGH0_9POAL|nr:hypothetical protein EJB05_17259 [Eragrostis curvula]
MGTPSQGSAAVAAARVNFCPLDLVPVFAKEMIAGGAAGAFSKTAIAPLERVKILLQTRTNEFGSLGVLNSLKKVRQHDGIMGFYKGNGASVLRIVPYAALHFMAYERYRCWILNNCPSLGTGPLVDLLAGSASGGTAVLCTYPLDLARTKLAFQVNGSDQPNRALKMTSAHPTYGGIRDVFRCVYAEGGVRALYRGVGLKAHVPEDYKNSVTLRLSCGAAAGLFGQTLTYPLDVVRRQMQVQSNQQHDQSGIPRIRGTFQGLKTIKQTQGWRQLFAGLSLNYIKVVPSVAIGFTAYDTMKHLLKIPPREKKTSGQGS